MIPKRIYDALGFLPKCIGLPFNICFLRALSVPGNDLVWEGERK
jgi:hypothetical protein